jgi:hypothetical protein
MLHSNCNVTHMTVAIYHRVKSTVTQNAIAGCFTIALFVGNVIFCKLVLSISYYCKDYPISNPHGPTFISASGLSNRPVVFIILRCKLMRRFFL